MDDKPLDCLVIGGGPAGLTAAIYLARFHLNALVVDGGKGRAATIPCTRNHAGYPDGISGAELIELMKEQAQKYGAKIVDGTVTRLEHVDPLFEAEWGSGKVRSRSVLLATGVTNRRPPMDEDLHDEALTRGQIRYCPICDGYEVTDKKVGVLGSGHHGVAEAVFLRGYTADVTLIAPHKALDVSDVDRLALEKAGIETVDGPAEAVAIGKDCITVDTADGHFTFDSIYPALGSDVHGQLAKMVGARMGDDGCVGVDSHMRTSVEGVYAAGDLVIGLDQISSAMGQGGIAATAIRNDLAKEQPLLR
ncbi:NAD(P)/FAD-dependent oxidoreductase [Sphingomonas sp. RB56-2]|uniref:Thioredoxin reductase n=1 Tax=Sphingomonas brevis TaxID=2908206 RepID=A0ABT0S6Y0_9SPHN|nr:NAD(P)/FAD-dependent oxidoreductase [Sphingomonas brevis]MCL6740169.1 NAD(P)/FAD-dependent oxidoreductase [Sphingomonas brevis]